MDDRAKYVNFCEDIIPGQRAAGFEIGTLLEDILGCSDGLERPVLYLKDEKILPRSEVAYQLNTVNEHTILSIEHDRVRLCFKHERLYAIYLFDGYQGAFDSDIFLGSPLKHVSDKFPIEYDYGDEMHYPADPVDVQGIGFYAEECALEDSPEQLIAGICVCDWRLMTPPRA